MERYEGAAQGQTQVEGEVKRSEFQSEESTTSSPEINPFLVEPILCKLLKLVERVSELKELRKICQTWDEFNFKEIEDRAFDGKLKAIDFWTNKFHTISKTEANLVQFMRDTSGIPRLFYSFNFNFPESWTILSKHMEFFSIYPVTFVHLGISSSVSALEQIEVSVLLKEFMESEIWGNLKEITISLIKHAGKGLPNSSPFVPSSGNIDRKLQKLDMKNYLPPIFRVFESDFASGKYTNLTSMSLARLPNGNLNFPGLDLSKLTRLEIGQMEHGSPPALKFTSGLVNLARNGMKLKNFGMSVYLTPNQPLELQIDPEFFFEIRLICSNLTQFFSSQSATLENLSFGFVCHLGDPVDVERAEMWYKIHLPEFEVLQSLKLTVDFQLIEATTLKTHKQLFGMTQDLTIHSLKIVKDTLVSEGPLVALKINPATEEESGQIQVKRFEIFDTFDSTSFMNVIGSVEELHCPAWLFYDEVRQKIFPWEESLRSLFIYDKGGNENLNVYKLKRFKKLERLVTKYNAVYEMDREIQDVDLSCYRKVEDYLATFKEAIKLPLTSITFIGPNMGDELKEEFIKYFPFPVEFKISL